jgi:cell division protein FtsN
MAQARHPSFGGTLTGFIAGLLVGMLVALAVAIYISKVPVPFMNKGTHRSGAEGPDADKAKDWDPNAALYGKNPVKAAEPPSETPPAAPNPVLAPPAVVGAPVESKSEDPLGDLARERAKAPDPFIYYVQVGAFRSADEAEAMRAKLSLAGLQVQISVREVSGQPIHRVRLGPFESRAEADQVMQKMSAAKINAVMVRVQRSSS